MSIVTKLEAIKQNRIKLANKVKNLGLGDGTENLDVAVTKVDGIEEKGSPVIEVTEGTSVSLPAGYYSGGTLKGMTNDEADADKYKTQTKTVTPTKEQQTVNNDDEYYALDEVIVEAIPAKYQDVTPVTTIPYHVLTGDKYVDSAGAVRDGLMPNNGKVTEILDTTKISYTVPEGYHAEGGSVSIVLEEKSVTPDTTKHTITPATGKVLSKVTVDRIPLNYADVSSGVTDASSADAAKAKILAGNTFVGYNPTTNAPVFLAGTMPNRGRVDASIDGIKGDGEPEEGSLYYTIPEGYHDGTGKVVFDDSAIVALLDEI